ncbi:D-2-hydroxyacid dehydrogenase [Anaerolineae bacterium CFX7]|nr:D-2-hydroxyacid dehydrogenase [Anaerolineae bacterium CFX7]
MRLAAWTVPRMNSTIPVLLTMRFGDNLLDELGAVSPRLAIRQQSVTHDRDDISALLDGSEEILYCMNPPRDLARAPNLKWVQLHSAGVDRLREHPIWDTNIIVTTTSGIHAVPIGEFTFALLLALARKIPKMVLLQERAEWLRNRWEILSGLELRGKTIGIVGYGSIGREIGRIAKYGFHMRVLAMRRTMQTPRRRYSEPGVGDPEGRIPEQWFAPHEITELAAQCDVLALAAPATAETHNLIGETQLRAMKPHALLLNIARGELVDDRALVIALKEGWIAGAGLDAYAIEPLPRGHPLWRMDNVIVAPHVASATGKYNDRAAALFAENLRRYLTGLPLLNVVPHDLRY